MYSEVLWLVLLYVSEHILKALSSLQTTEEKLAALCKKYADLHEDHRILQSSFKQTQRKLAVVRRCWLIKNPDAILFGSEDYYETINCQKVHVIQCTWKISIHTLVTYLTLKITLLPQLKLCPASCLKQNHK